MQKILLILINLMVIGWCRGAAVSPLTVDRELSNVEIDVRATVGSFVGHLADYEATLKYNRDSEQVSSAEIRFNFADVKTGEEKRDRHMHEWQETETYPTGKFVLWQLTPGSGGVEMVATGELTFHGHTQKLEFPVAILTEGRTVVIDGETIVDTQQFGLPIIRMFLALKVNPLVTIRFHLHSTLKETA